MNAITTTFPAILRRAAVAATLAAAGTLGAGVMPAAATLLYIGGVEDPANSATVAFDYDPSTATLGLSVTNTSTVGAPIITGIAFNAPDGVKDVDLTAVSGTRDDKGWDAELERKDIDTPGQYGLFDIGVLTGKSFNGGYPNDGIETGATGWFTLTLKGLGLEALATADFLDLMSAPKGGNPMVQPIAFRFQATGLDGKGSDVGIVTKTGTGSSTSGGSTSGGSTSGGSTSGTTTEVPEPATLGLLGLGVLLIGAAQRRRD